MNDHTFEPSLFGLADEPDLTVDLPNADATIELGRTLTQVLQAGDLIGLIGNLGAGKTTFSQGIAEGVGAAGATSPTYTLLNVYRGDPEVFHFDLYRLESVDDLEGVGYWDYIESGAGISVVEWLDHIPEAWPGNGVVVHLEYDGEGRRARIWSSVEAVVQALG